MKLTRENIHAAGSSGTGFNRGQLAVLGIEWPPKKGWLTQLIGTEVSDEKYKKFMDLKKNKFQQGELEL